MAERQYGVVSRAQLVSCGLSPRAVDRWAAAGRLRRLHPGVFAVGHAILVPDGRRLAAVLACGPSAVLSFGDAGAVWGLCRSWGSLFHVTVPPTNARSGQRPGIHVHVSPLRPDEMVIRDGIPVTSVARTLLDHASVSSNQRVAEAVDAAFALQLYDQRAIDRVTGRGRAGSARLRKVVAARHPESHASKSNWERAMLRLLDAHDIPRPQVNALIQRAGIRPDLLWRIPKVAVEWDSWAHHHTREQFEEDHKRTLMLQRLGYTVLRFTWRQVQDEPELVIADIRRELGRTS